MTKTKIMKLVEKGKPLAKENVHVEFTCPFCKGIATVYKACDVIRYECHACGAWKEEREKW